MFALLLLFFTVIGAFMIHPGLGLIVLVLVISAAVYG